VLSLKDIIPQINAEVRGIISNAEIDMVFIGSPVSNVLCPFKLSRHSLQTSTREQLM